jgi:hypothetical protein
MKPKSPLVPHWAGRSAYAELLAHATGGSSGFLTAVYKKRGDGYWIGFYNLLSGRYGKPLWICSEIF